MGTHEKQGKTRVLLTRKGVGQRGKGLKEKRKTVFGDQVPKKGERFTLNQICEWGVKKGMGKKKEEGMNSKTKRIG